jgi:cysteine desulfurase
MGMDPMEAQSAVRLSLSTLNTEDDVLHLIEKIKYEVKRLSSFASILN